MPYVRDVHDICACVACVRGVSAIRASLACVVIGMRVRSIKTGVFYISVYLMVLMKFDAFYLARPGLRAARAQETNIFFNNFNNSLGAS